MFVNAADCPTAGPKDRRERHSQTTGHEPPGGLRRPGPSSQTSEESIGEPAMKVFTTGQVAKICKVAPRTVSKWFDSGRLKGYRIPGSQDRRIPRDYLIKFLKEHGMPLGDLEDEAMAKVLIVAQDQVLIENLRQKLPIDRSFK